MPTICFEAKTATIENAWVAVLGICIVAVSPLWESIGYPGNYLSVRKGELQEVLFPNAESNGFPQLKIFPICLPRSPEKEDPEALSQGDIDC
jgi:hypothetical protein